MKNNIYMLWVCVFNICIFACKIELLDPASLTFGCLMYRLLTYFCLSCLLYISLSYIHRYLFNARWTVARGKRNSTHLFQPRPWIEPGPLNSASRLMSIGPRGPVCTHLVVLAKLSSQDWASALKLCHSTIISSMQRLFNCFFLSYLHLQLCMELASTTFSSSPHLLLIYDSEAGKVLFHISVAHLPFQLCPLARLFINLNIVACQRLQVERCRPNC